MFFDLEEFHFLLKLWKEGRFHPPLPGGDPEEYLFQLDCQIQLEIMFFNLEEFHLDLLTVAPSGLGIPRTSQPELIHVRSPFDKNIIFGSCNNRQDPCPRVDGFRGVSAVRDSANSSGYGGAADKGMTMVKITNLPEHVTSKHKLYELFRTFGSMTHVEILRSGGIGFVDFIRREDAERAINQLNGWCGARLMLVKPGPEQGLQYGQKMIKPGDAPESGHGWIRDTARPFWQIEGVPEQDLQYGQKMVKPGDAPESGRGWIRDTARPFWRKPIRDHQFQSKSSLWRKPIRDHQFQSKRKWTDRNRSQFGCGRPYWKP